MTKQKALAHFGGSVSALMKALGLDQSSYYSWGKYPPPHRQLQIEALTGLRAEASCDKYRVPAEKAGA